MREPPTIAGFIAYSIARIREDGELKAEAIEVAYREAVRQLMEQRKRADNAEAPLRTETERTTARDSRIRAELRRFCACRPSAQNSAIDRLVAQLKAEFGE